jgi:predicted nuclease of predicted toxin-antitoxin system
LVDARGSQDRLIETAGALSRGHGVSMRVVEWLRSSGHDAIHLRDGALQRLPNGEILRKAIREERGVLTFDLDFGEIVAASNGRSVSVILFRLRNTRADFVIQRLEIVLK